MALEIIWTDEAKEDYRNVVSYLLDQFGDDVAEKYTEKLFATVETLSRMPHIGRVHKELKAIRQQVIRPYTIICYTIVSSYLVIVNLKDSRQV